MEPVAVAWIIPQVACPRTPAIGLLGDQAGVAVRASGLGINRNNAITNAQQPAIDERDILWFVLDQGRVRTNDPGPIDTASTEALAQPVSQDAATVLLIGKDGGLKARAEQLDLPALFARIDAMPMRRREIETAQ